MDFIEEAKKKEFEKGLKELEIRECIFEPDEKIQQRLEEESDLTLVKANLFKEMLDAKRKPSPEKFKAIKTKEDLKTILNMSEEGYKLFLKSAKIDIKKCPSVYDKLVKLVKSEN